MRPRSSDTSAIRGLSYSMWCSASRFCHRSSLILFLLPSFRLPNADLDRPFFSFATGFDGTMLNVRLPREGWTGRRPSSPPHRADHLPFLPCSCFTLPGSPISGTLGGLLWIPYRNQSRHFERVRPLFLVSGPSRRDDGCSFPFFCALSSIPNIGQIASQPVQAYVSDRWGRRMG